MRDDNESIIKELIKAGFEPNEIKAVEMFLAGKRPDITTDITEGISYGYGKGPDDNGFWEFQLPVQFNDTVSNRLQAKCLIDLVIELKSKDDFWTQEVEWEGQQIEVAHVYRARFNKNRQEEDLMELPDGWRREFAPHEKLYVIDYDPRHMMLIKSLPNLMRERAIMTADELVSGQKRWPAQYRNGIQLVGSVPVGKQGCHLLMFLTKTFRLTGKKGQERPQSVMFGSKQKAGA